RERTRQASAEGKGKTGLCPQTLSGPGANSNRRSWNGRHGRSDRPEYLRERQLFHHAQGSQSRQARYRGDFSAIDGQTTEMGSGSQVDQASRRKAIQRRLRVAQAPQFHGHSELLITGNPSQPSGLLAKSSPPVA